VLAGDTDGGQGAWERGSHEPLEITQLLVECRVASIGVFQRSLKALDLLPLLFASSCAVSAYVSIRQYTSAYVSIRQYTSAYATLLFASSCAVHAKRVTEQARAHAGGISVCSKSHARGISVCSKLRSPRQARHRAS
jgi:hypothetical protein